MAIAAAPAWLGAEVELPAVFTNGMVLQSGMPVPVWGKADPGESVSIRFAGQTKTCTADAAGHWSVNLDPLEASGRPSELVIGSHTLTDVLVGEVWLCAGQSNMQWLVGKQGGYPGVEGGEDEIAGPGIPELRIFSDPKEPDWKARGWRPAAGEDLRSFSATGYFFGKALRRELGVPVGIVNVSRGGSSIQSWIPADFNVRNPFTRHYSNLFHRHRDRLLAFNQANDKARLARQAGQKDVAFPPPLPSELAIANRFGGSALFDELVEPLASFATRGVIWYQGESNADFAETAQVYDSMLRDLIEGWRCRRGQERLPWYLVQLPCWNSHGAAHWPWIRQGQLVASRTLPDVHLAVTCDIGDASDLHPPQKRQVGERLAMQVLAGEYGREGIATGPVVRSVRREKASLQVEFETDGSPLQIEDGDWQEVQIAGADGVFHPAKASLHDNLAEVSSEKVPHPTALRYGWAASFRPTLFNRAGFPASPFSLVVEPGGAFRFLESAPSPIAPLEGDRWCAIGDSITHAGGYLKTLYLFCVTRYPGQRFDLLNCGAGGDTAAGTLHRRMEKDILVHSPSRATVMLGINDIWWEHGGHIGPDDYIRDISRIVDRLHENRSGVILITPSPYDDTAQGKDPLNSRRSGLDRYVRQLRNLAKERAIPLIDVYQAVDDITRREQARDANFSLMKSDRVHPDATGAFVIAETILRAMRAPALVSRVSIDAGGGAPLVENATIGKLSRDKGVISFELLENALPFPASSIPAGSLSWAGFTKDLNRQMFQVTGLTKGNHELTIDDQVVGTFSAGELEDGVNLADLPGTPQNRQAAKVAELVEQRGAIISDKLRHIAMIEYGELKKFYSIDDAASPARDLEGSGRSYPEYFSLKPHQSRFIREAKELDDRIWQANRPLRHRWRLTPVK